MTEAVTDPASKEERIQALPRGRPRKIVFVLPEAAAFGGLERHLFTLLRRLAQTECDLLILCIEQDLVSARMEPELRARVSVQCRSRPNSLLAWLRLIRESRPQILVFCYSWIEAFSWQGPAAGLLSCTPKRYSIQHLIPAPLPPPRPGNAPVNLLRRLIGKRARRLFGIRISGYMFTRTICVSNAVRNALVHACGYPAGKTITVANGVSTAAFTPSPANGAALRAALGIRAEEFLLVCASRLSEEKGVDILLHAVSRVLRTGLSLKCIVVGDGPLREDLAKLADALGLSSHLIFAGFQPDVRPYLQAASAFILTSHLEGLPLSVLEAMACELPCIVTDVGGSAEAVKHGETGIVIRPGSIDDAEAAILDLATHPAQRALMGHRGRERVCRDFNLQSSVDRLAHILLA
jgi:glycosyltransferase involved in cell wall biosynthesis